MFGHLPSWCADYELASLCASTRIPEAGRQVRGGPPSSPIRCAFPQRNDRAFRPFALQQMLADREAPVRVLVVEDDPLIREFVVEALREAGYQVVHARTGEEALDWCRRQFADVLITDVMLPGKIDGWQIGATLSQLGRDRH